MGEEIASSTRGLAARANDAAFWLFWGTIGTTLRVAFRVRRDGPALPAGPCVIVANHASYLDPIVLSAVCRRRVVFLMNAILCRTPPLRWFYRWNRVIPVEPRGNNREAMRHARATLAAGGVLGVFPEGGISRDGRLVLGNPGAVALALQGSVPVVPVGIIGAADALPPHAGWPRLRPVRVRFGAALSSDALTGDGELPRKQRLQVATRRVMDAIALLAGQTSREAELEALAGAPGSGSNP